MNKPQSKISILNKPKVLKKMIKYKNKIKNGEYGLQLLELNYNNDCNFDCDHCFSRDIDSGKRKLTVEDVKSLADQAHDLGVWQWHLQGGEPMAWRDLEDVVAAIGPDRFHIFITSNGWFITEEKAKRLAEIGVDKVSVSIDSFIPEQHDEFRHKEGAYDRAMQALFHVRDAGMQANLNTCVTAQNCRSQELLDIINYANKHNFTILFVIATSSGAWAGCKDMLISEDDNKYLEGLKKEFPFIHRDIYPLFDFEWGCRTMNGLVYVTPEGDLLSCPFVHIGIGNILDEPLEDILKRGWRVKYFRDFTDKCLAGENLHFIDNYMSKAIGRKGPVPFDEAFSEGDLYEE